MRTSFAALTLGMVLLATGQARAAGDAVAGKTVFDTRCMPCHSTTAGTQGVGPSLAGVVGRKAGAVSGFHYSPALEKSGLTWDDATLESFLANPMGKVPGTAMPVSLPDATERQNVIAYLATLKGSAAAPQPQRIELADAMTPRQ